MVNVYGVNAPTRSRVRGGFGVQSQSVNLVSAGTSSTFAEQIMNLCRTKFLRGFCSNVACFVVCVCVGSNNQEYP